VYLAGGSLLSIETTQSYKPEVKSPVAVKGTKDGLLFLLDEQCDFPLLLSHLDGLFHGDTKPVFDGPQVSVAVDYGARVMNGEQQQALLALFLGKENFVLREWSHHTAARRGLSGQRDRWPAQYVYKGTVRAGQCLTFDGDIVVIGDVNPGGEIVANGDVYVFGKLRGIAHAGAMGNEQSIIAAAEFAPMQLRIGNKVSRAPAQEGQFMNTFMEFAYVRDGVMAVDKLQYLSHWRQQPQLGR